MTYRESLAYLEDIQSLGIKFGLDNVRTILASLGNPHRSYPTVLVAGSNGKGSVSAMLTRILTLHGYKTGLYTSPHLVRYEERIRISDQLISSKSFSRILTQLRSRIERLISQGKLSSPPTHFELLTCLAFVYFSEERADMAVLEVGMGGRFDATNVSTPLLAIITTISEEHQNTLGETLAEIAYEKAGIIKPGVPVVCGVEEVSALQTIRCQASESQAPLIEVFAPENFLQHELSRDRFVFQFTFEGEPYMYSPSLPGRHQGNNAAVAIAAACQLSQSWNPLDKEKILQGIASTHWDGRLETLITSPPVLLDGAHNREGALALRQYINSNLKSPVIIVFATMQDKKIEDLTEILFPLAQKVILTRYPYFRAATPEEIYQRTSSHFHARLEQEPDVEKAVRRALDLAGEAQAVVITGSLFLVGEVKKLFPDPSALLPTTPLQ